ncbi:23S rRNA (cytidine(2498)-2'-O)-methyltransferase RlmM [Reinekea marinisedimentorum]|uniref:23S rRNA (Cytidine2498-2'-O)-methyltransferase n=1 Tax=Reinekea marinisedimentorum TaxID=230495 RepID=A0A4R3I589_9GAMM|nr:23S rRNA (cytidine(2498)-2'-O)-methyltransferase RlmM [Reinekea marinisedimentorum]TCS40811.1 23S rRNA (cytidine2498-2'-O)-methyltransferase [Reinekea marinisedimentorum]
MSALLMYCRPGFEKECLAEISAAAAERGCFGWSNLEMHSGFVLFETEQADTAYSLLPSLVFCRDAWPVRQRLQSLNPKDRLSPILSAVEALVAESGVKCFGGVSCEYAEGDAYHATSKFAGKFVNPLRQALRNSGLLTKKENPSLPALRLFFKESSSVLMGVDKPALRSRWPMGVARLKFPPSAPSRSTLKLEEAFIYFLGNDWRQQLENHHTAVDLGAAPGGWTWQLVNHKMYVHAVDNGPMDAKLMETALVDHVQEDGFVWKPKKRVDWLVCDMVEKPARVARLMYEWLHERHADAAIFNLKLPMKKRLHEWQEIKEQLETRIAAEHPDAIFRARHLYHDREEITVYLNLRNQNG